MIVDSYLEREVIEARARQSVGSSDVAIYEMVQRALSDRQIGGGTLVDVGCGSGNLWSFMRERFERYVGVDVVRYEGFPTDGEFVQVNLDTGCAALPDNCSDVVVGVETIEHLENPRAFMRELVRLVKPGGWLLVTTPNQLSLLSLLTLIMKGRFSAFQDTHYPAHIMALLEVDLVRIANECGIDEPKISYSYQGRIVLTPWHYPEPLARIFPRALSDNLMLMGRKLEGSR